MFQICSGDRERRKYRRFNCATAACRFSFPAAKWRFETTAVPPFTGIMIRSDGALFAREAAICMHACMRAGMHAFSMKLS